MRRKTLIGLTALMVLALSVGCAPAAPAATPTKAPSALVLGPTVVAPPSATPAAAAPPAPATAVPKPAATPTPAVKIKRGGTVIHGRTKDTNTWDPVLVATSEHMVHIPLFENLLRYNMLDEKTGKSEYQGELAESWQIVDPVTIVLKLRKGVKFHDGTDFNAEAAKWSLERSMNHPKSTGKGFHGIYEPKIEVVDAFTIRMKLKQPSGLILANLSKAPGTPMANWSGMVSKAALEKLGEEKFGSQAVGTGPIVLVEWKRDDRAMFKKFDNYWEKGADGQPLPYYDAFTYRIIPDSAALFAEIKVGTVHITDNVDPPLWSGIKANPDLTLRLTPWHPLLYRYGLNQESPLFKTNLKLRQALAYAVDRKGIADAIGPGFNEPNYYDPWIPVYPGWDQTLPKYQYDEAKAKQLLKDSGHPEGLEMNMIAFPATTYLRPAEMLAGAFRKIGVRVTMDVIDDLASRPRLAARNFEVHTWYSMPSLDPGHLQRTIHCDGTANWSYYCNRELDKCMAEGDALLDWNKRTDIYRRCQKIIYEDALLVGTQLQPKAILHRTELKGVRLQASLMDLWEAWLDK